MTVPLHMVHFLWLMRIATPALVCCTFIIGFIALRLNHPLLFGINMFLAGAAMVLAFFEWFILSLPRPEGTNV